MDPICERLAGMPESKVNLFWRRIRTGRVPATPEIFISSFSVLVKKGFVRPQLDQQGAAEDCEKRDPRGRGHAVPSPSPTNRTAEKTLYALHISLEQGLTFTVRF